jgi:hypothetical protein
VRRVLTVGVVLAVAVIVAAAFLDALGGSSGVEGRNETSISTSGETIAPSLPTSTFPPRSEAGRESFTARFVLIGELALRGRKHASLRPALTRSGSD